MLRGAGRIEGWGRLDDCGACTCRLPCAQRFSNHFSGADLRRYTLCPRGVSPASTWRLLRLPGSVFLRFVTVPLLTGARAGKATRAELAAKGASSYCERHLILNTTLSRESLHRFVHSMQPPLWIEYNRSWIHEALYLLPVSWPEPPNTI